MTTVEVKAAETGTSEWAQRRRRTHNFSEHVHQVRVALDQLEADLKDLAG